MKLRHVAAYRNDARAYLLELKISFGQKFETLSKLQLASLTTRATKYRKHVRGYYEWVQRMARQLDP